jgi:TetR/AcrR family transcriptional repressor of nem operon
MRTSREAAARTREKIIEIAGQLFIRKGFSTIGIAEVMKAAGLTHGGFYGHFDSKAELIHEAVTKLFESYAVRWREIIRSSPKAPVEALLADYFSAEKGINSATRCVLTSLSQEVGLMADATVRSAFSTGVGALVRVLEEAVHEHDETDRRQVALAMLSSMIGAVTLARAVDDAFLAGELLAATSERLESGRGRTESSSSSHS